MSTWYTIDMNPESKQELEEIKSELQQIKKRIGGTWTTLWHGIVYGAGYIIGAALILFVIGWILNIIGVIPAFQNQVNQFREIFLNISHQVK